MATGRMNQLTIMANLCSSILEGIEHLMAYKENERLKDDAVTGLLTLAENLKGLEVDNSVVRETRWIAEIIRSWLFTYDQKFKSRLYQWYYLTLTELRSLMKAETEKCPFCGGKGAAHYGTVLYRDCRGKKPHIQRPVRVFMKCQKCKNYYLAREEIAPKVSKSIRRTKAGCERILSDIEEFVTDGSMLFVGEVKSQLCKAVCKAGYFPKVVSLETMENEKDMGNEEYQIVMVDRISKARDMNQMIKQVSNCLAYDGVLWFDGPDLDKYIKNLEKKGDFLWKWGFPEICFTDEGLETLPQICGLTAIACRHVGTTLGRIEVIVKN